MKPSERLPGAVGFCQGERQCIASLPFRKPLPRINQNMCVGANIATSVPVERGRGSAKKTAAANPYKLSALNKTPFASVRLLATADAPSVRVRSLCSCRGVDTAVLRCWVYVLRGTRFPAVTRLRYPPRLLFCASPPAMRGRMSACR